MVLVATFCVYNDATAHVLVWCCCAVAVAAVLLRMLLAGKQSKQLIIRHLWGRPIEYVDVTNTIVYQLVA